MTIPTKSLFLDIDGVITSQRTHLALHGPGGLWRHFDPVACAAIRRVCEHGKGDIAIVISSSWRRGPSELPLMDGLRENGLAKYLHPDWATPNSYTVTSNGCRGLDIAMWLRKHPEITDYAILDDDCDMLLSQLDNFIYIEGGLDGIMERHIKRLYQWAGIMDGDWKWTLCEWDCSIDTEILMANENVKEDLIAKGLI